MTRPSRYGEGVREVASSIVAMNEDSRDYSQIVDAVHVLAPTVMGLIATAGHAWRNDVGDAIHQELVDRGVFWAPPESAEGEVTTK